MLRTSLRRSSLFLRRRQRTQSEVTRGQFYTYRFMSSLATVDFCWGRGAFAEGAAMSFFRLFGGSSYCWSGGFSFGQVAYAYGPQILIIVTLLAITIFRKEMSCNRCYAEQEEENRTSRTTSRGTVSSLGIGPSSGTHRDKLGGTTIPTCWDDREADSLLEGAGCYCSGVYNVLWKIMLTLDKVLPKDIVAFIWQSLSSWWVVAAEGWRLDEVLDGAENWCVSPPHAPITEAIAPTSTTGYDVAMQQISYALFPAAQGLPTDAAVQILSFLHPKDVVSFACTSSQVRNAVQDGTNEIARAIWKTLWYRDYAWIVDAWDVGREAVTRSLRSSSRSTPGSERVISSASFGDVIFTREFYFRFGVSYMNFVLAGQYTPKRCLVGLGGHIYDLTDFVDQHPGSPESVIVHAGRDASAVFESMRHTVAARRLAQKLCVIVDMSLSGGTGVWPTAKLITDSTTASDVCVSCPLPSPVDAPISHGRRNASATSTLEIVRDCFVDEQDENQRRAALWRTSRSAEAVLGDAHSYYDPFCEKWKVWYINTDFEAVFVSDW